MMKDCEGKDIIRDGRRDNSPWRGERRKRKSARTETAEKGLYSQAGTC